GDRGHAAPSAGAVPSAGPRSSEGLSPVGSVPGPPRPVPGHAGSMALRAVVLAYAEGSPRARRGKSMDVSRVVLGLPGVGPWTSPGEPSRLWGLVHGLPTGRPRACGGWSSNFPRVGLGLAGAGPRTSHGSASGFQGRVQ